ncbi:MAG TPA: LemA family protein [Phenylobacterium sp.]|nr:LemA family protein [Phenylobacterium sp.]HSV01631.1 LemA family protein [Phenylobacterium sp.]
MSRLRPRLARFALVLVAPLVLAACGYNVIPTQQVKAQQAWAEVQNQYQRRADLIPNLVNTVKGYAAQEKSVLVEVTEARASATQVKVDASTLTDPAKFQQYQAAQDRLSGVLGRLMMISERYPDLKSNQNFLALQSQLEGTENRIAIARRDYNQAVADYNTSLRTFPQMIWANLQHAKPMQLFSATSQAQSAPTVSFDTTPPPPPSGTAPAQPGAPPPSSAALPPGQATK